MPMPTKYRPEMCKQARRLCLLGATDKELADFFEVGETNLKEWYTRHPEFGVAVRKGKIAADANVASSLYRNALRGNVMAQMYWLNNRRRLQWRQRQDVEVTGANGGPVKVAVSEMTDLEAARRLVFALEVAGRAVEKASASGNAAGKTKTKEKA